MDKKKDRRKHKRFKVQCSVFYNEYQPRLVRDQMFPASMVDISLEGALIEVEKEIPVGEFLTFEINLIGWQHFQTNKLRSLSDTVRTDCLRVNATVLRVQKVMNNKFQIGVRFENIKAYDRDILHEYITKRILFKL